MSEVLGSASGEERPSAHVPNGATNVTHLLWADRWIEVVSVEVMGESGWQFKNGRDTADWLLA